MVRLTQGTRKLLILPSDVLPSVAAAASFPIHCDAVKQLSSGSMIILIITWRFRIILQNIRRRVVGSSLSNISLSNIFATLLLA